MMICLAYSNECLFIHSLPARFETQLQAVRDRLEQARCKLRLADQTL